MPGAQGVVGFVNRNNTHPLDEKNARYPPADRGSSQPRQPPTTVGLSQPDRQRKAANARVTVPAIHPTHVKAEPDADMSGLATVVAHRSVSVASSRGPLPRTTFDDTDLDDTISSGLSTLGGDERYVTFTTDYNRPSHELLRTVDAEHYARQYGGYKLDDNRVALDEIVPDNWREIVETEKGLQARLPHPSLVDDFNDGCHGFPEDDREYDDQEDIEAHSPGREKDMEDPQHHVDDERHHNWEQVLDPTPSRTPLSQMPPPPPPLKMASTVTASSIPTSKTSSYVEASEGEAPSVQPPVKQVRTELDYDLQVLKTMSYADLDKQSFEKDPRAPQDTTPIDGHAVLLTLHRKLGSLSRMKEEDMRAMFLAQKDQEWEATGAWFMGQFQMQMRRLLEIRQERRMTALKFETEVKKRQAGVAAKTGDVEQELRYLKTGGKDLMGKRVSPLT